MDSVSKADLEKTLELKTAELKKLKASAELGADAVISEKALAISRVNTLEREIERLKFEIDMIR